MSTMGRDADEVAKREREKELAYWSNYGDRRRRKPGKKPRWNAKAWWGVITERYLDWDRKI